MRNFIINSLQDALTTSTLKNKKDFLYKWNRKDGDLITIKGKILPKDGIIQADFRIERTKKNGHRCSAVPVFGMPMKENMFHQIAEIAVESL